MTGQRRFSLDGSLTAQRPERDREAVEARAARLLKRFGDGQPDLRCHGLTASETPGEQTTLSEVGDADE